MARSAQTYQITLGQPKVPRFIQVLNVMHRVRSRVPAFPRAPLALEVVAL